MTPGYDREGGRVSRAICTLVVDDSPQLLTYISDYLGTLRRFAVVGTAVDGQAGGEQVDRMHPDLVLMDVNMPRLNGVAAAQQMKSRSHAPRVVLMSLDPTEAVRRAVQEGIADGYCAKHKLVDELMPLIDRLFPATDA
jgi:DNA-binding NarL/FixJ family response regulator